MIVDSVGRRASDGGDCFLSFQDAQVHFPFSIPFNSTILQDQWNGYKGHDICFAAYIRGYGSPG